MTDHAPLPPSAAARWGGQCPGSAQLEAADPLTPPDDVTEAAAWGVAGHWLAAKWLRDGPGAVDGMRAPNGVVVDEEMVEAVGMYVDDVLDTLATRVGTQAGALTAPYLAGLHIEERVDCSWVHADNWGTPDLWYFAPRGAGGLLLIWDAKFGHRFVDAYRNWQMIDYTSGILSRPEFRNLNHAQVQVVMTVVQPRNYHPAGPVRRWAQTALELAGPWQELRDAAFEARHPEADSRTIVGPECRDCKGRHRCAALHAAADSVADLAGDTTPISLPPIALGVELRALRRAADLLDARITGLEAEAVARLRGSQNVPFFALEQGTGREQWTVEADTLEATLGSAVLAPRKALTPAQVRKALGKDAVPLVDAFATRPPGPLKLIDRDDDAAARVFQREGGT